VVRKYETQNPQLIERKKIMETKIIKTEKIEWKTTAISLLNCLVCNKKDAGDYIVEIRARLDDKGHWHTWKVVCCNECKDKDPIEIITAIL